MSLVFYRSPMSTSSIIDLVLAELDIPHESVTLDIRAGDTRKPEFLKVNPNGRVPVIIHDGVTIWESAAITMYLGETFGVQKGLYPAAGPTRGIAMRWIVWTNVSLGDTVGRWTRNTMDWYPADQKNAKAGEAAQADMQNCLRILDEALEVQDYLCGSDYTLADTHLNSLLDWLRMMKVDLSAHKNIDAWGKRCCARPAYVRVSAAAS